MHKNNFEKYLKIAILLTSIFFVVEIFGGLISGSLSLLGDAGHMFRDVIALVISLSALNISKKLPSKRKTFGFHRVEIFAAFLNGILLLAIGLWILLEAYNRFYSPRPIESTTMLIVALIGLGVNLYVAFKLHGSHDLNVKSAFLHVLTDAIFSLAVILAAILIFLTGKTVFDPILSTIISVIIVFSAFKIVKESVMILLEYTPKDVNFDLVLRDIQQVEGIQGVHNVHIWSLCSNINVMDAHVFTTENNMTKIEAIKNEIKKKLEKHNIKHTTLEFEFEECILPDKVERIDH
ncbi:MAG: cation diffusion facilitator family transporter [Candidatus Aminicenantaceae bacterium]|jgi:cobalt-zinc-cadmium efflux system protein